VSQCREAVRPCGCCGADRSITISAQVSARAGLFTGPSKTHIGVTPVLDVVAPAQTYFRRRVPLRLRIVPAFDPSSDTWTANRLDWSLLQDGYVTLFWSQSILDETPTGLAHAGYQIVTFDSSRWQSASDFYRDTKAALSFPDYFGNILNALDDCLSDVALYEYGADPEAMGTVLVMNEFDSFVRTDRELAEAILDIVARQARTGMMCLVHSNDPDMQLSPVGATPVQWNPAEFHNAERHPTP
jgi:hypothetical protein